MAAACGAPTAKELASALAEEAGRPTTDELDLFALADELESERGRSWVNHAVAAAIRARSIAPSGELLALTLVPGRLIATTNYDDAIELAARGHGLVPVTLTPSNMDLLLRGPGDREVFVIHLHGTVDDPATIVLTSSSYEDAFADERLELATRVLGTGHTLVFLGHSLAENERHLRRDLSAVAGMFGPNEHLLLHSSSRPVAADAESFKIATGVLPIACPDEDGSYRFVRRAAQALGAQPLVVSRLSIPIYPVDRLEAAYEPMFAAPAEEVSDEGKRAVWLYGAYLNGPRTRVTDLDDRRLLIIGAPGTGKSQSLIRLGIDGHDPAVYLELGRMLPPREGEQLEAVFVEWMRAAYGLHADVPVIDADALNGRTYAFLLDGFDECPPDHRDAIADAVGQLSMLYPHHRWVLASRRVPQLAGALPGFTEYELMPSAVWLRSYAAQRGVHPDQLAVITDVAPGLNDLLETPLFAAAAIDKVLRDEPLPGTPLELLLDFASRGMREEEARLRTDRAEIEEWVDRLCLTMLVAGRDEVTTEEAADEHLRGLVGGDATVDWLVTRVLLWEGSGSVRPHIRTLRDARAARALRNHPGGESLVRRSAFIELRPKDSNPEELEARTRPDWQYVIDLLLADDLRRWRGVVIDSDPLSVARASALESGHLSRDAAIEVLWGWYHDHRIHIPRTREGQLRDDLTALASLMAEGVPPRILDHVVQSLESGDASTRANAVAVLAVSPSAEALVDRLSELLGDSDSVVRRRAAQFAAERRLTEFAESIAVAALNDQDELARSVLARAAVELCDDEELELFVAAASPRLRRDVRVELDRRWDRRRQLEFLHERDSHDAEWLEHVVETPGTWTDGEIELLAEVWGSSDRLAPTRRQKVAEVLSMAPVAALRGYFAGARKPLILDLLFLLDLVTAEVIEALAADLDAQAAETLGAYLLVKPERDQARARPRKQSAPRTPSLESIVRSGDVVRILSYELADGVTALEATDRAKVDELVAAAWKQPTDGKRVLDRIWRTSDGEWRSWPRDWTLLSYAAATRVPLTKSEWVRLANLGFRFANFRDWLRASFDPAWMDSVAAMLDPLNLDGLAAIVDVAPAPLSEEFASALAVSVFSSDSDQLRADLARRLAVEGVRGVLQEVAKDFPSPDLDAALVILGDRAAEERVLQRFRDAGCPAIDRSGEPEWLDFLRHPQTGDGVAQVVRTMLRRGDEPHELRRLFRALEKCLGIESLKVFDDLMQDDQIPEAQYLWYRRDEALLRLDAAGREEQSVATVASELFGQG